MNANVVEFNRDAINRVSTGVETKSDIEKPYHAQIIDTLNECYLYYDRLLQAEPNNPLKFEWERRMRNLMEAKNIVRIMVRTKNEFNKYLED